MPSSRIAIAGLACFLGAGALVAGRWLAAPEPQAVPNLNAGEAGLDAAELDHAAALALHSHAMAHDHRVMAARDYRRQMVEAAAHQDATHLKAASVAAAPAAAPNPEGFLFLPGLLRHLTSFPSPIIAEASPTPGAGLPSPTSVASPPAPTSVVAPPSPSPVASPQSPTYRRDVAPILALHCVGCHVAGGLAPFALTDYALAQRYGTPMRTSMEERLMPPMPADVQSCTPLDDPRLMTQAERQVIIDWVAAESPEGSPADAPPAVPGGADLGAPSQVYDIGTTYTPTTAKGIDDYHCFVIEPGNAADVEWRMADIVPTNGRLFHHGILYLIQPNEAAGIRQKDAAEAGAGYTCFGGPGVTTAPWVIAEAPGAPTNPYPAGSAFRIPGGALVVLQIHYNMLNGAPGPDRTQLRVWEPKEPVNKAPRDLKVVNPTFRIPAGNAEYSVKATSRIVGKNQRPLPIIEEREGLIWGASGHMHLLGKRIKLDLLRADGSRLCLLDIPSWDFNWQGNYLFKEPVLAKAGDRIEMTCTWDNSAENQPYVDGKQLTPREVRWGEGTLDEMCLGGVVLVDP